MAYNLADTENIRCFEQPRPVNEKLEEFLVI